MPAEAADETLRKELDQLRSDIAALSHTLKEIATDQGSAAYERVRRSTQSAKDEAVHAAGVVGHEIGERPFTSVLSAFSVGLLLGMLFSRRS